MREVYSYSGGAVRFLLRDNHVRFEINTKIASRQKLRISFKRLAPAMVARQEAKG